MKRFVQDRWLLTLYIYIYIYIYIYHVDHEIGTETSLPYRYYVQPFLGSNPGPSLIKMEGPKLEIGKRSTVYKL